MRTLLPQLLFGALLLLPSPVSSQSRHELTLDASAFRGTIGYAGAVAPAVLLGGELGFGFPQTDWTLSPAAGDRGEPELREYLHGALFVRQRLDRLIAYDAGVRAAVVDLWPCRASDCWPGGFLGAYVQPMLGGRRVAVGPRLLAGWVWESANGRGPTFTAAIAPLNVRLTLGW